jgi:hypothetical protein
MPAADRRRAAAVTGAPETEGRAEALGDLDLRRP